MVSKTAFQKNDEEKAREALLEELKALRGHYSRLKAVVQRYERVASRKGIYQDLYDLEAERDSIEALRGELRENQKEVDLQGEELEVQREEIRARLEELRFQEEAARDHEARLEDEARRRIAEAVETERKGAEDALRVEKQQAELYLDVMGHDINNMHQVALGYLELALSMPPGEEQAGFIEKSVEVLQRSARLISNVRKLEMLRKGALNSQDMDVCQVLPDVQREYRAVPHKTVTLNLNGHEHCTVRANELLREAFANLVGNAIKHTGDRADVVVDMDVVRDNGTRYCRVAVEDNGPGIPDGFKGFIFNRGLKGTGSVKGTGIGLFIVKSLVDSYGGKVWVEDRVKGDHKQGARFVVLLPAIKK